MLLRLKRLALYAEEAYPSERVINDASLYPKMKRRAGLGAGWWCRHGLSRYYTRPPCWSKRRVTLSRPGIYREAFTTTLSFKEAVLQVDGIDLSKLCSGDASLYTPNLCDVRSTHAFVTTLSLLKSPVSWYTNRRPRRVPRSKSRHHP
jgi:hypothetical protein